MQFSLTLDSVSPHHATVRLDGELDCRSASLVESFAPQLERYSDLTVQADGLTFLEGRGVAAFLGLTSRFARRGGRVTLTGVQAQPRQILASLGDSI